MSRSLVRSTLAALALVAMQMPAFQTGTPARAQGYPSKPVTIIVPLAAGTGMDTLARIYGEQLAQALGKPVVIENKPGAGLMLGAAAIAQAAPDGHTLGISTVSPARRQSGALQEDKLRSRQGFLAGPAVREVTVRAGGRSRAADQDSAGIDQARQGKCDPDELQHAGGGFISALVDGIHGAALRSQAHPCALSQLAAVDRRHRRRSCQCRVRGSGRVPDR